MTKKTYKTPNTRRHVRMNAGYLMKYRLVSAGPEAEMDIANLKDFSAGGLKFWSENPYREGDLIEMSLLLPPLKRAINGVIQAVRVRRAHNSDVYYIGAKFHQISLEDQKVVKDFIEKISNQKKVPKSLIHDKNFVKRSKFLELVHD